MEPHNEFSDGLRVREPLLDDLRLHDPRMDDLRLDDLCLDDVSADDIDGAMAHRSLRLRFTRPLEARFEHECEADRCRRVVSQNWLGLSIYLAFLLGDWILVRDVFWTSLYVHLCMMAPLMVVANAIIANRPPVWLRESLLALTIVLTTLAIVALMLLSRSPLRPSEHLSVVLVILFATIVQRIRFPYVVTACIASGIIYVVAVAQLGEVAPWENETIACAVFCGVILFSLVGCWNLEREQRTNFLLRLRDRLRHRELEALSRRDPLTGTGNRRALEEVLARCRPAGPDSSTAVLLFDIDFFKTYNDVNGHLAGDACLRRVAGIIAANVREGSVFRFGGEEFLVLLEKTDLAAAHAVAERIRTALAAAAIPRDRAGECGVVTMSSGVAAAVLSATETTRHLIADADLALYAAKRGGRNRVEPAPRSPSDRQAA